jgi:hypothetical protein
MSKYIATTDEVMTCLQLDSSKEDLVISLIPIVTAAVIRYTRNDFTVPGIYVESELVIAANDNVYTITADSTVDFADEYFYGGDFIRLTGSIRNDNKVYEISSVANNVLTLNDEVKAESSDRNIVIEKVEYPEELKLAFFDLIKFTLNKDRDKIAVSLADYSASYSSNNWPDSIRMQLNQFRKIY